MDIRLRDLRHFVVLAEELHLTRAAERLYLSQPALSKQLRSMEERLGFALFLRRPRGLELTRHGEVLLPVAREIVERWHEVMEEARNQERPQVLVLGIQTAGRRDLHRSAFERFRSIAPGWDVQVRQIGWQDPSTGLLDGTCDLALCWLPVPEDDLSWRVLLQEPRHVAMPADHRLATRREVAFTDLLDEPFLALPESAGALRDFWLAVPERQGRPVVVAGVVHTPDEAYEAVALGSGVALVAEGNSAVYAHPGVVCRPVSGLPPAGLAVVWRTRDRRPAVEALRECFSAPLWRNDVTCE